jgi:lysyl-tRNA synthetase class 2
MLRHIAGGAKPFITDMNALDDNFCVQVALELDLKHVLVIGFDRVFEIGRAFRNEGSPENRESAMIENYQPLPIISRWRNLSRA